MTVVVYVKRGCPYCNKVLAYLEENPGKDVEVYTAEEDFKTDTFKKKYGNDATFPRGYSKEGEKIKLIGGSGEIIEYLDET